MSQFGRWNICIGNDLISAAGLIYIIEESRQSALKKVNEELIKMYWKVGEFLSKETERASYGDAYIDEISREIQEAFPGIKGFNRRGLYRMKKFYETYKDNEIVTPLVTQISYGFSQLRALEFFVFRKMEMPETQNPPAMRVESICL